MDVTFATKRASVVALGLMVCVGLANATAEEQADRRTYTWSAELVEFDPESAAATVRARLVERSDAKWLETASEGERMTLTWSGISWASAIRHLSIDEGAEADSMSMPVEFVALSDDGVYVDFRVPVPVDDRERIGELEPGRWITATAIRPAATWHESVTQMRAFTDVS
jgi:hypothetical protein